MVCQLLALAQKAAAKSFTHPIYFPNEQWITVCSNTDRFSLQKSGIKTMTETFVSTHTEEYISLLPMITYTNNYLYFSIIELWGPCAQ